MGNETSRNILIVVAALILGAVALFIFYRSSHPSVATTDITATSTATSSGPGYSVKIGHLSSKDLPPAPDMNKKFSFDKTVQADVQAAILSGADAKRSLLVKDQYDFNAWVALGTLYQMAGDYNQAKAIWEYVTKIYPTNTVTHSNIANLYDAYLHDYAKAESEYEFAIKSDPSNPQNYRNLFDMYLYRYKQNTSAAEDILKKGITASPDSIDLKVLLARYYVEKNRPADARAMFESAIKTATAQHQASIAQELKAEEAAIK
jgi:tetratricopeptide (TPR) repeat protein